VSPIDKMPRIRIVSPMLSGLFNAFVWMCIGAVVVSLMLTLTAMKETSLSASAFVVHGIASMCGGFVSGKKAGSRGLYQGGGLGILYGALVALAGFLGFDAKVGVHTVELLAVTLLAGAVGGMVGVNAKR